MFPDCVGEVDVISDAENIKKLLKMSHSYQGPVRDNLSAVKLRVSSVVRSTNSFFFLHPIG